METAELAMRAAQPKPVRAVERAIDVLACFGRGTPSYTVGELQRRVKLSRPTLYRLLATLEGKGLVRSFGEPQRFALDHRMVELAGGWQPEIDVARAGLPTLRKLWEATGETVALFVPTSGCNKLCVQELPSRHALVFTRGAGFVEPNWLGASGKVILAFMTEEEIGAAMAQFKSTVDRRRIRAELAQIRRLGFWHSEGEIIVGAIAIAAPIFGRDGRIAGSVCVFGPEARITETVRQRCVEGVIGAGEQISMALGYRAPATRSAAE